MKTMKLLFGVMIAFSTLFLFSRCTNSGERSANDTTASGEKSASEEDAADKAANDTTAICACDNEGRFITPLTDGGKEISVATGKSMVKAFHDGHTSVIKGGFISKVALDTLFCSHQDYNGLFCYIAQDPSGQQLIVIEGVHQADAAGATPTEVRFDNTVPVEERFKVFITQTMCPSMCGECGNF